MAQSDRVGHLFLPPHEGEARKTAGSRGDVCLHHLALGFKKIVHRPQVGADQCGAKVGLRGGSNVPDRCLTLP
jgi:hypothetical protein